MNARQAAHLLRNPLAITPPTFGSAQLYNPAIGIWPSPAVLSNSNLTETVSGLTNSYFGAFISDKSGVQNLTLTDKRYYEVHLDGPNDLGAFIGFYTAFATSTAANPYANSIANGFSSINHATGIGLIAAGSIGANAAYATVNGAIVQVAVNGLNGKVFFGINGTYIGSQNPTTDSNPAFTLANLNSWPVVTLFDTTANGTFSSGATVRLGSDCQFALPSGYKYWNQS